jgi:hypothetical protein
VKIPIDQKLRGAVVVAKAMAVSANNALSQAEKTFDQSILKTLPPLGVGRDAHVSHVHADAHFGHQCPDRVISRVVNAFGRDGEVYLRIHLGTVKGRLGVHYANLKVTDVIAVVSPNFTSFTG